MRFLAALAIAWCGLASSTVTHAAPPSPAAPGLFSLVAGQCSSDCDSDLFKPVWMRFEDSTGLRTAVNTASIIQQPQGGFIVMTYSGQPGQMFDQSKISRLYFNCQGQLQDIMRSPSSLQDFGPKSVAGQIEQAFCNARPMLLNSPGTLAGTIRSGTFEDCCQNGKSKMSRYRYLVLARPTTFVGTDSGVDMQGVTQVQISAQWSGFKSTPDGSVVTIRCREISEGTTGHYALPIFCVAQ